MRMVRCKFGLWKISEFAHGATKELHFQATYDPAIPEDQRFAQATPSGSLVITVDNPGALAQFQNGKSYYLDISPA